MTFLADENFPGAAVGVLRASGRDVLYIAELCPGVSDEVVAELCSREQRVLLTFDKDFGQLVYRRGLESSSGIILFRFAPDSPEEAARAAVDLIESRDDFAGSFCVVTKDLIRIRPLRQREQLPGPQG